MPSTPIRLLALLAALVPGTAHAEEYYFVTVFGSQRALNRPKYTHSFALFVKATGCGPDMRTYDLQTHLISWMPATLEIRPYALKPEPGVNLDLKSTFDWAFGTRQHVAQWGPYQIDPYLYDVAVNRVAQLQGGAIQYRSGDLWPSRDDQANCIFAILAAFDDESLGVTTLAYGQKASWLITRRMRPWIINAEQTHDWLNSRLGLDGYPIVHRRGNPPLALPRVRR